jgi:hypothetical protein
MREKGKNEVYPRLIIYFIIPIFFLLISQFFLEVKGEEKVSYRGVVQYITHVNTEEKLNVWSGEKTVFFYPSKITDEQAKIILEYTDNCLSLYQKITGSRWPTVTPPNFPNKASLAVVEETCGAGCGAGGKAEILLQEHREALKLVKSFTNPITWVVGFYEFGRQGSTHDYPTFPFYRALDLHPTHDLIASAFPEYMSYQCVVLGGVSLEEQRWSHFHRGYPRHPGFAEYKKYYQESGLNFQDLFTKSDLKFSSNQIVSAIFTDLDLKYGKEFMLTFFAYLNQVGKEKQVSYPQEIENNLLQAANYAGGIEVKQYLQQEWKIS